MALALAPTNHLVLIVVTGLRSLGRDPSMNGKAAATVIVAMNNTRNLRIYARSPKSLYVWSGGTAADCCSRQDSTLQPSDLKPDC